MRVDCYNASEIEIDLVDIGDTFYFESELWIKVAPFDVDVIASNPDRCYIVSLSRGEIRSIKKTAPVVLADTKVVVNTTDSIV